MCIAFKSYIVIFPYINIWNVLESMLAPQMSFAQGHKHSLSSLLHCLLLPDSDDNLLALFCFFYNYAWCFFQTNTCVFAEWSSQGALWKHFLTPVPWDVWCQVMLHLVMQIWERLCVKLILLVSQDSWGWQCLQRSRGQLLWGVNHKVR